MQNKRMRQVHHFHGLQPSEVLLNAMLRMAPWLDNPTLSLHEGFCGQRAITGSAVPPVVKSVLFSGTIPNPIRHVSFCEQPVVDNSCRGSTEGVKSEKATGLIGAWIGVANRDHKHNFIL